MDRRSFLSAAAIAPFVRVEQHETSDDGAQLEMGDVVYGRHEWLGEGLAMVMERTRDGRYSVSRMPGSKLHKTAWWDRNELILVERGAYYRALSTGDSDSNG